VWEQNSSLEMGEELRGRKWWKAAGDSITRSFITCTLHRTLSG
jgi:hypothetical protein